MKKKSILHYSCIILCLLLMTAHSAVALSQEGTSAAPLAVAVEWESVKLIDDAEAQALLLIWLTPPEGHYIYAYNTPKQNGLPTVVKVQGQNNVYTARYLAGTAQQDYLSGKAVHVYIEKTPVFISLPDSAAGTELTISITALICSEVNCTRFAEKLTIQLPDTFAHAPDATAQDWWELYQQSATAGSSAAIATTSTIEPPPTIEDSPIDWGLSPQYAVAELEVTSLEKAILLGLIAGLLLNFMPCVLPVVSLKITGFVATGGLLYEERLQVFRSYNIFFAFGVLACFGLLALVLGLGGMLWGQLFQNVTFVVILACLVFSLGLSLFGVYTLPILDLRSTSSGNPKTQAFFSGLLATLLATPCSGPLLGGVLGWALRQPALVVFSSFIAIGLGMSLPYWLMALRPNIARYVPRPGAWTSILEQIVGFFLMGTTVYLLYLLPNTLLPRTLFVLLLIAIASWLWGQIGPIHAPIVRRIVARTLAVGIFLGAIWGAVYVPVIEDHWEEFSTEIMQESLGKDLLLVEFTADWCPNCKALEYATLTPDNLAYLRKTYNLRTIQVDMTRYNAEQKALLEALGSSSIPVVAIFPRGDKAQSPIVLRDLFTKGQLERAIQEAVR